MQENQENSKQLKLYILKRIPKYKAKTIKIYTLIDSFTIHPSPRIKKPKNIDRNK